jgi:uncharacterized protein
MILGITIVIAFGLSLAGCGSWMSDESIWSRGTWSPQHHTLKELRDLHVVKQQKDYSCGAAALATLMIYYFGDNTSEEEILNLLQSRLDDTEKRKKMIRGFSLLDLKHAAESKGYRAAGFQLSALQLAQLAAPAIVFVEPDGYKHFAVFRGMDRGRIFLADPSRGNLRMSLDRFLDEWSGVVFVLGKEGEEKITSYPLQIPRSQYIQPELARQNGILDIDVLFKTLPQR